LGRCRPAGRERLRGGDVHRGAGAIAGRVDITSEADVATACQEARRLGERLGFAALELAHLVTATAEVAGNAWRHGGGGRVELEPVEEHSRVGVAVRVVDDGPGITDVEAAMRDGWSSVGSLGVGLPGARRLMDEFRIAARPGGGAKVEMTRWRGEDGSHPRPPFVDWAAAPASVAPGRRAVVCRFGGGVLIAAVAGLGGDDADVAAETARQILERYASQSPIALAERCHADLASTGGVVLGLASLSGLGPRVTLLSLGKVSVALLRAEPNARPAVAAAPALRGVAGRSLPQLRATTLTVAPGDAFVLAVGVRIPTERTDSLARAAPGDAAIRLLGDAGPGGLVLVARRR
jgi:serine/threonine-protein kinase RsbT